MTIGADLRPALTGASTQTVPDTPADLVFSALAVAARDAPSDDEDDPRPNEIAAIVQRATPAVRTRALQLSAGLIAILTRLRSIILLTKSDLLDADVAHGDAEVLPDGWLVVTMAGVQIGRVPYNPERGLEDASRMAEEMLAEHVRLHVARSSEPDDAPSRIPIPNPEDTAPRPDGVRARRLVVQ